MSELSFAFLDTRTPAGWAEWELTNVEVVDGALAVASTAAPVPVHEGVGAVDAALDECGNLYLLGAAGLARYDPRRDALDRVACLARDDADALDRPTALAVTDDSVVLAGRPEEGGEDDDDGWSRVRALSRHLLQTRWVSTADFAHVVALAGAGTDVYVLDEGPASEPGRLSRLRPDGTTDMVVAGLAAPVDVAVDDAGNLYVLDRRGDELVVGWFDADAGESTFADAAADRIATVPEGTTCIEAGGVGVVTAAVRTDEDGTVLYRYRFAGGSVERRGAVERTCSTLVARPGDGGGFYALDASGEELYVLAAGGRYRPRPHRREGASASEYGGQAVRRLDSGETGTEWHRVTLDPRLGGPGTQVRVQYFATDEDEPTPGLEAVDGVSEAYAARLRDAGVDGPAALAGRDPAAIAWIAGVAPARAAAWIEDAWRLVAERWERRDGGAHDPESDPRSVNPRDALLESATGRYLWVKLDLAGTPDASPRVRSFRAYFPRQSYLRHLPSVYREDARSEAFLTRFLSVFESTFVGVEEDIERLTRFFDPCGVPEEYLSWLGRWLAVDTDEAWPEPAKRELLARAPELFRKRGTREGLLAVVGIYLDGERAPACEPDPGPPDAATDETSDEDPATDETSDEDPATDETNNGEDPATDRGGLPFLLESSDLDCIGADAADARAEYARLVGSERTFLVLLDPSVSDEEVRAVERIVDAEAPAHAIGRVVRLRPWIQLGTNAYLGVNSRLPTREFVLERSALGEDSALVERESHAQVGLRGRLGRDSLIS